MPYKIILYPPFRKMQLSDLDSHMTPQEIEITDIISKKWPTKRFQDDDVNTINEIVFQKIREHKGETLLEVLKVIKGEILDINNDKIKSSSIRYAIRQIKQNIKTIESGKNKKEENNEKKSINFKKWENCIDNEEKRILRKGILSLNNNLESQVVVTIFESLKNANFSDLNGEITKKLCLIAEENLTKEVEKAIIDFLKNKEYSNSRKKFEKIINKNKTENLNKKGDIAIYRFKNKFTKELSTTDIKEINSELLGLEEELGYPQIKKYFTSIQLIDFSIIDQQGIENLLKKSIHKNTRTTTLCIILQSIYLNKDKEFLSYYINEIFEILEKRDNPGVEILLIFRTFLMYDKNVKRDLEQKYNQFIRKMERNNKSKSEVEKEFANKIINNYDENIKTNVFIFGYEMDLFLPEKNINIEIDGTDHKKKVGYDYIRDTFLGRKGIKVVRIEQNNTTIDI